MVDGGVAVSRTQSLEVPRQCVKYLLGCGRYRLVERERSGLLRLSLIDGDTNEYREACEPDHKHIDLTKLHKLEITP